MGALSTKPKVPPDPSMILNVRSPGSWAPPLVVKMPAMTVATTAPVPRIAKRRMALSLRLDVPQRPTLSD